jgi:hypothetical protein
MKSIPKEYNSIVASGFVALLLCGGAGYFVFEQFTAESNAVTSLQEISSKIKQLQAKPASPTDAHLKEITDQRETVAAKIEELRNAMRQIDLPAPTISPEDFPKSLNQKVREFTERAGKEGVQIPPDFSLGFEEYQSKGKLPPKNLAPFMARQLEAVSVIMDALLETQPLELKSFSRKSVDELPDYLVKAGVQGSAPATTPAVTPKKGDESKKSAAPTPKRASLWAESYQLEFSNRPDRLRTFLNRLAKEKKAFFVVRSLRLNNSQELPPSKVPDAAKGNDSGTNPAPGALTGATPPGGFPPTEPITRLPGVQSPDVPATGDAGSPYIVGDEHVLVQMTIDLVSVVPPALEPETKKP